MKEGWKIDNSDHSKIAVIGYSNHPRMIGGKIQFERIHHFESTLSEPSCDHVPHSARSVSNVIIMVHTMWNCISNPYSSIPTFSQWSLI